MYGNEIKIIDNFLTLEEMQFIQEYFENPVWRFGLKSTKDSIGTMFKADLDDNKFFSEYLLSKICKQLKLSHVEAIDIHANGQTVLNDGTWHHDFHKDGKFPRNLMWTVLLYVSDITSDNVEHLKGHTDIRMDDNSILSIEPLKNRLILFDSSRNHRGLGPGLPGFLRISITYKLKNLNKVYL